MIAATQSERNLRYRCYQRHRRRTMDCRAKRLTEGWTTYKYYAFACTKTYTTTTSIGKDGVQYHTRSGNGPTPLFPAQASVLASIISVRAMHPPPLGALVPGDASVTLKDDSRYSLPVCSRIRKIIEGCSTTCTVQASNM